MMADHSCSGGTRKLVGRRAPPLCWIVDFRGNHRDLLNHVGRAPYPLYLHQLLRTPRCDGGPVAGSVDDLDTS